MGVERSSKIQKEGNNKSVWGRNETVQPFFIVIDFHRYFHGSETSTDGVHHILII